ncbi:MAG: DUF4369 domain-containing protein, partial [Flavobacteriales bacterium]
MIFTATLLFRRLVFAGVVTMAALGCSSGSKGTIQGTIEGAQGKTIYLERFVNNRMLYTDSAVIGSDGSFLLKPSKPLELNYYRIVVDKENSLALITDSTEAPIVKAAIGDF